MPDEEIAQHTQAIEQHAHAIDDIGPSPDVSAQTHSIEGHAQAINDIASADPVLIARRADKLRHRATMWSALAIGLACAVVALSLIVMLVVVNNKNQQFNAISTELADARAALSDSNALIADRLDCERKFNTLTQDTFREYSASLGDVLTVVALVSPGPERENAVQGSLDQLADRLAAYRATAAQRKAWNGVLPCPVH